MSYADVETLIGPPLCVIIDDNTLSDADRNLAHCRMIAKSVPMKLRTAEMTLSYAEPRGTFVLWKDLKIFVSLSGDRVNSVYIRKDDFGICCKDGLPTSPFYWVGSRELLRDLIGR